MDDGHGTGGGRGWRPARLATIGVFLVAGLSFGSWVARIPEVQDALGLDDAQLGLTLLGTAIGSIAAMTGSGVLIARFGSRAVTTAAALGVCVTLPLLPLAPSMPLLFAALLLFGAAYGTMDVAMNAQAVLVEERYGRPIMSSFHGVFSLGGLLGAASAGLVVGAGVAPVPHLLAVGLALALLVAASAWRLIPAASERRDDGPSFALPTGPLLGLGAIGFGALLAEGAIADWGAVYLRDVAGAGAAVAATGYTAFSLTMMVGRFLGDALTERLGPVPMVRGGGLLVAAGLAFALLLGNAPAALVGFALVGAGLAATFPIVLSAAGRVPGVPAGRPWPPWPRRATAASWSGRRRSGSCPAASRRSALPASACAAPWRWWRCWGWRSPCWPGRPDGRPRDRSGPSRRRGGPRPRRWPNSSTTTERIVGPPGFPRPTTPFRSGTRCGGRQGTICGRRRCAAEPDCPGGPASQPISALAGLRTTRGCE
jgi:predicted MFS family arabinose efflux permease